MRILPNLTSNYASYAVKRQEVVFGKNPDGDSNSGIGSLRGDTYSGPHLAQGRSIAEKMTPTERVALARMQDVVASLGDDFRHCTTIADNKNGIARLIDTVMRRA